MNKLVESSCIFCKIANGDIPSYKVFEDEDLIAFLDVNPMSEGHCLVVSKGHYCNFIECPKEVLDKMTAVAQKIAAADLKLLKADGVNLLSNINEAAGQSVMHFHMHVIPRYQGKSVNFESTHVKVSEERMKEIAALLSSAF